jgi:uncharacterized protein
VGSSVDLQLARVEWLAIVAIVAGSSGVVADSKQLNSQLSTLNSQMRCPVCQREFKAAQSAVVPFCSERCRTIDLGRWLDEGYSLPVVPDPEADELPEPDESTPDNGAPRDSA